MSQIYLFLNDRKFVSFSIKVHFAEFDEEGEKRRRPVSPVLDSCHWEKKGARVHMRGTLRSHKGGETRYNWRNARRNQGETKLSAHCIYRCLVATRGLHCILQLTFLTISWFLPVFSLNTGKLGDKPKPV